MDCVGGGNYYRGKVEMEQFAASMKKTGQDIILSLSPGQNTSFAPIGQAFAEKTGFPVMARMTGDFWDHWTELYSHFQTAADAAPFARPNFFPDLDMLPIGFVRHVGGPHYANFNQDEQRALMSTWVMARAPLIWGGAADPALVNATTMGLIANRYRPHKRIGSGSFGEIYVGVDPNGEKVGHWGCPEVSPRAR